MRFFHYIKASNPSRSAQFGNSVAVKTSVRNTLSAGSIRVLRRSVQNPPAHIYLPSDRYSKNVHWCSHNQSERQPVHLTLTLQPGALTLVFTSKNRTVKIDPALSVLQTVKLLPHNYQGRLQKNRLSGSDLMFLFNLITSCLYETP